VTALADRDATLALETVNGAVEAGEDPRQLNRQLIGYLRVLLHQRAGGSPDADERAAELAQRFDLLELAQLARQFSDIDFRIRHASYSQLPLEVALVEGILRQEPVTVQPAQTPSAARERPARAVNEDLQVIETASTRLRDKVRGNSTSSSLATAVSASPSPAPISNGVANGTPLTVDQLADLWQRIRDDVKAVNRRVEALLSTVDPVAVDGNEVTLASPYDFHRGKLNSDDARTVVEDVIARLTGRRVHVTCILREEIAPPIRKPTTPAPVKIDAHVEATVADGVPNDVNDVNASVQDLPPDEAAQQRINAAKNIFDAEEVRD
jgi:DNA polymerase III gamma/tau subunit